MCARISDQLRMAASQVREKLRPHAPDDSGNRTQRTIIGLLLVIAIVLLVIVILNFDRIASSIKAMINFLLILAAVIVGVLLLLYAPIFWIVGRIVSLVGVTLSSLVLLSFAGGELGELREEMIEEIGRMTNDGYTGFLQRIDNVDTFVLSLAYFILIGLLTEIIGFTMLSHGKIASIKSRIKKNAL